MSFIIHSVQLPKLFYFQWCVFNTGIPSEKAWGRRKKIYYDADSQKENDIG